MALTECSEVIPVVAKKPKATGRRTRTEKVESPFGNGFDKVDRVVDTITAMHRRGQLSDRQAEAAGRYRDAHDLCAGGLTGTLDPGKTFGGSFTGREPAGGRLWAAGVMTDAGRILGRASGKAVRAVVGEGLSLTEAAKRIYGRASRASCDKVSTHLNDGLNELAEAWSLRGRRRKRGTWRASDAVLVDAGNTEIQRGGAYVSAGKGGKTS